MKTCTKHTHSSEESALRCYERTMRQRVDKIIRQYAPTIPKFQQIRHDPPVLIKNGSLQIYTFFSAVIKAG